MNTTITSPVNAPVIAPVIAIDGTAASGKGTLARKVADMLDMAYLDTGLLYRYVGIEGLRRGLDLDDGEALADLARTLDPAALDDPELRSDRAGPAASLAGRHPAVRQALFDMQRDFAHNPPPLPDGRAASGAVLDGRDIGTVICPDAPVKLYVTAQTETRADRRHKELQSRGISVSYEAVLADMLERDRRDAGRDTAPMKPADDALIIDTTDMDIGQVLEKAMDFIRLRLNANR